jgi:UDP-2-acetamido-2-deoxy-ribo-hexuluronate aminotransferase
MNNQIPFFSLQRQWNKIKAQITQQVQKVFESQLFVGGKFVKNFEDKLEKYLNSKHVISCNSGTDALWLAIKALNIQKNSIVLTTPFSFIASSSEIIAHKAHPVFIDIESDTCNISPQKIHEWLTKNATMKNGKATHKQTNQHICGMLTVNIFGQCANWAKINEIAKEWNLWTIEDAAQSIGSKINEQKSGTFADISTFSFYPTKNLGACGDGGAVCTNKSELSKRLLKLRNHGRSDKYAYEEYGINSRLDAIQAVILDEKLNLLDDLNNKRRKHAERYCKNLSSINFIQLPREEKNSHNTYHQFCIQLKDEKNPNLRDDLAEHLKKNNIGCNIYFPESFTQIDFLQTDPQLKNDCPIAENMTQNILALPIWPELTNEEIDHICNTIKNFCQ